MKDNNGIYTERLKETRVSMKYSMRKMAKKLGYNSPSSYMYIEKGEVQPSIEMMNRIARILGKPVNYFFKLEVQDIHTHGNKNSRKEKV